MKKKVDAPYRVFGELLAKRRMEAGIAGQAKLASLLRVKQQSISRWELGQSRPRRAEIDRLAQVLNADSQELVVAAGYAGAPVVASFDEPFPLGALTADKFERFSFFFLNALYPSAKVHRAGGTGHQQDGLDLEVEFLDGKLFHFQCKRVQEFGAAKVSDAVRKYKRKAAKKIILLSRIASPKAREAVRAHKGWDIWDQEDVSLQIRKLPKQVQIELVDTFFKGMRLALLGEAEASVWQTPEVFFAPFTGQHAAFTHTWNLVGRTAETSALLVALSNPEVRVAFLLAPGGGGKSRVLKRAVEQMQAGQPIVLIRFLSPSEEVSNKSLEDLGAREKLLVVDDAHDRADLKLLFQYAANPGNNVKLLLALRPYGADFIRSQASNFALLGPSVATIDLKPLTLSDATALAKEVFETFSGPVELAKEVASLTLDCPLATVMGAWVVSKEKKPFLLANNESAFRELLMARFRDIITGEVGRDQAAARKVLRVIALVQPFGIGDASVFEACASVEGLSKAEVSRIFRELVEAGVLFRRSGRYRLSPDLLADYIIESECIGQDGTSTGYAEQLFDVVGDALIEHVVLNLGRLDWRRANGDPSNSKLLDGIWSKLKPQHEYNDPHLRAVKAVAYYQPGRTLDFVERLMRDGQFLIQLPDIIKFTTYNFPYLQRACECLWELGKNDARPTHQHPSHAVRMLSELSGVSQNKPYEYNEAIVTFALGLMDAPENWTYTHTPFDLLGGISHTEGHSTSSTERAMTFSPYFVRQDFVSELRKRIVTATLRFIKNDNLATAVHAAKFLRSMLVYPSGQFGARATSETRDAWSNEFVETLSAVRDLVRDASLDKLVLIEIARSISWHANYASGPTTPVAKSVLLLMKRDLDFRALLAILDPWGHVFEPRSSRATGWQDLTEDVAKDLITANPDGEVLRQTLEAHMKHLASAGMCTDGGQLMFALLQRSLPFAHAVIENALADPASLTWGYSHTALGAVLRADPSEGIAYGSRFEQSNNKNLLCILAATYMSFDYSLDDQALSHRAVLRRLLTSGDPEVAQGAVRGISRVAEVDKRAALDLMLETDFHNNALVAENAFSIFHDERAIPFGVLTDADAEVLLGKLALVPDIGGHWTQQFLAKMSLEHPQHCARLFMRRVEYAADKDDWAYRPSNHGPYEEVRLRFRESPSAAIILREVLTWLKSRSDYHFRHSASELFETMFKPLDDEIMAHLTLWVDSADAEDIEIIAALLREADRDFVFRQASFVSRFLSRAKQFGKDAHEKATFKLYASATSGLKSGVAGEPFPEDLAMKEQSEAMLTKLPAFAPERYLYQLLKEHAEQDINRSRREAEIFEE